MVAGNNEQKIEAVFLWQFFAQEPYLNKYLLYDVPAVSRDLVR